MAYQDQRQNRNYQNKTERPQVSSSQGKTKTGKQLLSVSNVGVGTTEQVTLVLSTRTVSSVKFAAQDIRPVIAHQSQKGKMRGNPIKIERALPICEGAQVMTNQKFIP